MRFTRFLLQVAVSVSAAETDAIEHFERNVRPVFAGNCQPCHSAATHMGGLALISAEAIAKGGNSGPAIVRGNPDESLLIQAVSHTHSRLRMPPQGKLSVSEIGALRRWIADGAPWGAQAPAANMSAAITQEQKIFWAFQPVRKPAAPKVRNTSWVKAPIDAFILARLESERLALAPPASKRTLLRRLFLDLIGMPPTPEDVDRFEKDESPRALEVVVERLLASPAYGERWGRYWLDLARYTDDKLNIVADEPYPNAFRYRDWVVKAFQDDMPYDAFVKAQIAADLVPNAPPESLAALGFYGMSAQYQEDRPDVTGKVFLGLTVGCAQCHDHKFDPVPTRDYYALLGVFTSTRPKEVPLAPATVVAQYDELEKAIANKQKALDDFRQKQARQLAEILATKIARYVPAAWDAAGPKRVSMVEAARRAGLDVETVGRWANYLRKSAFEHGFMEEWRKLAAGDPSDEAVRGYAERLQQTVLDIHDEIRAIEEKNLATLGGAEGNPALAKIVLSPYPRDKYVFWSELFGESRTGFTSRRQQRVLYYAGDEIDRFLQGEWKSHAEALNAEIDAMKAKLPPKYPFLHAVAEAPEPKDLRIQIRGNPDNLGEVAPRAFLSVLCDGEPKPFRKGSGRLELADAITSPANPLTARVMVNRIWAYHFGAGIVRTPSNFGQLGDRPSHPELLDYLAARFVESGWSVKAIHREILLSAAYASSAVPLEENLKADGGNRLFWRANIRRLDLEALRDSILAVAGTLDIRTGGPPQPIGEENNHRRTLYSFVSRRNLDPTLAMFDFPNANDTSEQRILTNTPIQRLYLLNSAFVMKQAEAFAERVMAMARGDRDGAIRSAYRLAYGRLPSDSELGQAREYLASGEPMARFTQALLASNEFIYVE